MNIISLREDMQYSYIDSGKPDDPEYDTIIIIHGHTFHGAVFECLFKPALSRGLRIIAINRRGYPGSTPITKEEIDILNSSSQDEIHGLAEQHGVNLARVIDRIMLDADLPPGRNVTLSAWSLGNYFLVNILATIDALDEGVGERLKARVKGVLMWDAPVHCFGDRGPEGHYVPLYDELIEPEKRGTAFGVWVAAHWRHGDIASHDFKQLEQRIPLEQPPPSIYGISPDKLMVMMNLSLDCQIPDTMLLTTPNILAVQQRQTQKAFLDPSIKKMWGDLKICHMVGDANCWPVIYGHWCLEDMVRKEVDTSAINMGFKTLEGGNHFVMWEHPDLTLDALQACLEGDMASIRVVKL
ncbi:hypothetical protein BJ165DRAFT_1529720 [Panaeolus papilionaceus]|nr:hypothetical protein BJ165DRAFT_1529720 [Panaeolus papilionaceus]